jgi:hypothetical protein
VDRKQAEIDKTIASLQQMSDLLTDLVASRDQGVKNGVDVLPSHLRTETPPPSVPSHAPF